MFTAYKSRAWWMISALSYLAPVAAVEDESEDALDHGRDGARRRQSEWEQFSIWNREGINAARNAVSEPGCEALTRLYVDVHGNLLPHLIAT